MGSTLRLSGGTVNVPPMTTGLAPDPGLAPEMKGLQRQPPPPERAPLGTRSPLPALHGQAERWCLRGYSYGLVRTGRAWRTSKVMGGPSVVVVPGTSVGALPLTVNVAPQVTVRWAV